MMTYKILGQSNPAATTDTTVYTVPASKSAVISTISLANIASGTLTYRVAVIPSGGSIGNSRYIAYETPLFGYSTDFLTIGATLATGDFLVVRSSSTNLAVTLFGDET